MAWYHPSVGYPCEYLGISTFDDSPFFARVECGLGCGEVKPPPVTSSLAVVPRGSRLNCPFRWPTRSPFESSGRSHAGRAGICNNTKVKRMAHHEKMTGRHFGAKLCFFGYPISLRLKPQRVHVFSENKPSTDQVVFTSSRNGRT